MDAATARDYYAAGWAASGGPLTDRVKAGSIAAQHMCGDLTEGVILRLGHLEGVWAAIYDRRLKLLDTRVAQAKAIWTANPPDLAELVRVVRRDMGIGEASPNTQPIITSLAAEALARQNVLNDLVLVVNEGLVQAEAEGITGAIALAADEAGFIGFDYELAFQNAIDALAQLGTAADNGWTAMASDYVSQALNGSITDLGNRLAILIRDQASYADMLASVTDLFDSANAVGYVTDLAMSYGLTQGALNLYTAEGVAEVNFVTAGDERVCMECDAAGAGGPYDLALPFPQPPIHGFCRCCIQANDSLPTSAFSQYVTDNLDEG